MGTSAGCRFHAGRAQVPSGHRGTDARYKRTAGYDRTLTTKETGRPGGRETRRLNCCFSPCLLLCLSAAAVVGRWSLVVGRREPEAPIVAGLRRVSRLGRPGL